MRISFFEEYPTEENMAKLNMVDWPATVLVSATSREEFESIRTENQARYPHILFGWWPTVRGSYWISGFSNPKDLDQLFIELTEKREEQGIPILLDLELPLKKPLYFKNILNIGRNKRKINKFLSQAQSYNLKVYTAEYAARNNFFFWLWQLLGISPLLTLPHTKLLMVYSSMGEEFFGKSTWQKIKGFQKRLVQKHPGRFGVGLGTIATGVFGNEPILSAQQLLEDIKWAKECKIEEVFIFRLGGMNEEISKILKVAQN